MHVELSHGAPCVNYGIAMRGFARVLAQLGLAFIELLSSSLLQIY